MVVLSTRNIVPTTAMTHEQMLDMAWAAGLADGEGCISIVKQSFKCGRRPTHRLRFEMVQNNRETLMSFAAAVGVRARLYPVKRTATQNRQVYLLAFDGMCAHEAISRLAPYLRRKRPEADLAMKYVIEGRVGWHPGPRGFPPELWLLRERYFRKLQRLK